LSTSASSPPTWGRSGMFKSVAAFATGDGGIMVFGIDPDELTVTGLDGEDPKSSGTACMAWCTAPWSRRRTSQSKTTRWTGRPSWCSTWHPDPRPHTDRRDKGAPGQARVLHAQGLKYLPCPARRTTRSSPHPPGAQREPRPPDPVRPLVSARTASPSRSRERRRPVVMADQHLWGQHKTSTTPCSGKDQHADNTDKTVLPGTRRHAC
jgi:hypothetical protein